MGLHVRRLISFRTLPLWVAFILSTAGSGAGCGFFNWLGNAECASMDMTDMGGPSGVGGGGGGIGGYGAGGDESVGIGVGGADSAAVGVGADSAAVGAGGGFELPPRVPWWPRRGKWRRTPPLMLQDEQLGYARQAQCTPQMSAPPPSTKVPFTTIRLREVAMAQGIGAGLTGILFNQAVGLAFENWVLVTMGQRDKRNTKLFLSPARQKANQSKGGLPASVIPEFVAPLYTWWPEQGFQNFDSSLFFEVKAVTGALKPSTRQFQILGLIDVAAQSTAGTSTAPHHPPPALVFTTTGNTPIDPTTLTEATNRGVAIWQQVVFEDTSTPPDNPMLYIGQQVPMNPVVYGNAWPVPSPPVYPPSTLTSPTTPPITVPGDPDPPEVE